MSDRACISLDETKERLKQAKVILLVRPSIEILGILSYAYAIEIIDLNGHPNPSVPIAYTDEKNIYISTTDMTNKEMAHVIAHELWHILMHHCSRKMEFFEQREKCSHMLWNLAADHIVNRDLMPYVDQGVIDMIDGAVFFEDVHRTHPTITVEELYLELEQSEDFSFKIVQIPNPNAQDGQQSQQSGSGSGVDSDDDQTSDGSGSGDQDGGSDDSSLDNGDGDQGDNVDSNGGDQEDVDGQLSEKITVVEVTNNKTGKKFYMPVDVQNESDDDIKGKEDAMLQKAKLLWNSDTINKGNMPGNIATVLDELLKIEVPWTDILEDAIMYSCDNTSRRTWTYPDIYYPTHRLPGKWRSDDTEYLVVGIDTSGSVSDKDLKKFLGIVCSSAQYFSKLIIMYHDMVVHQPIFEIVDDPTPDLVFDAIKEVMGRGGTSHKDLFDHIERLHEEVLISTTVFLTDFESDVQQIHKQYSWMYDVPMVWVLNTKHEVTLDTNDYSYRVLNID